MGLPSFPDMSRAGRGEPRPPHDLIGAWSDTWIGNIYLDDSGRDSPASLNSTGDM